MYFELTNIFLIYPVDLIVELDDMGYPDFEVFSQYDIFLKLYKQKENIYRESIKFFLGDVNFTIMSYVDTEEVVLYDEDKKILFDSDTYRIMKDFIRRIHCIPEDASKTAKKSKSLKRVLIETGRIERDYNTRQALINNLKNEDPSLINKMLTKLTISSQFKREDILDMKIYEFFNVKTEVSSFYSWKHLMAGIYTGTVDSKKINRRELDWFNN